MSILYSPIIMSNFIVVPIHKPFLLTIHSLNSFMLKYALIFLFLHISSLIRLPGHIFISM